MLPFPSVSVLGSVLDGYLNTAIFDRDAVEGRGQPINQLLAFSLTAVIISAFEKPRSTSSRKVKKLSPGSWWSYVSFRLSEYDEVMQQRSEDKERKSAAKARQTEVFWFWQTLTRSRDRETERECSCWQHLSLSLTEHDSCLSRPRCVC